jgi:hyperosmotically inducible protein
MGVVSATAQVTAVKDAWLVMKVHSEFVNEDALAGSNIDVDVKDGVVTLQGTVPSEAARAKAIAEARDNDGVKNVIDQLRIAPKTGTARRTTPTTGDKVDKAADKSQSAAKSTGRAIDDGWIKSKIYAQYMADWNTVLDDSDIDIDVKDNVVTLSGTVKSAEAKAKAVATAKATDGVKSVKDNLRVSTSSR